VCLTTDLAIVDRKKKSKTINDSFETHFSTTRCTLKIIFIIQFWEFIYGTYLDVEK